MNPEPHMVFAMQKFDQRIVPATMKIFGHYMRFINMMPRMMGARMNNEVRRQLEAMSMAAIKWNIMVMMFAFGAIERSWPLADHVMSRDPRSMVPMEGYGLSNVDMVTGRLNNWRDMAMSPMGDMDAICMAKSKLLTQQIVNMRTKLRMLMNKVAMMDTMSMPSMEQARKMTNMIMPRKYMRPDGMIGNMDRMRMRMRMPSMMDIARAGSVLGMDCATPMDSMMVENMQPPMRLMMVGCMHQALRSKL